MQSIRTRVNSVLRRSSFSERNDLSGNESDHRPSSISGRKSIGDKDSLKRGSTKKRMTNPFAMRNRSGTSGSLEHSQLAKEVIAKMDDPASKDQTNEFGATDSTPALDSSMEFSKIDFPAEVSKSVDGYEPAPELNEVAVVAAEEQPSEQILPEETIASPIPDTVVESATQDNTVEEPAEEPVVAAQIDEVEMVAPEEYPPAIRVDDASPAQPVVALPVDQSISEPFEPAPVDSSYSSTSSQPQLIPPKPLQYPQPLSAIDELHAKSHPLAEWNPPKEDVNYDADEYVHALTLFFLLPAIFFLGIPYFFPYPVLELASL